MADIEAEIEQELQAKSIEKDSSIEAVISDVEEQGLKPKKSKKVRSQAQIDAFEKARIKRAENFEKRKLLKEAEKQEKKEVKTKIKEEINNLTTEELKEKVIKKSSKQLSPDEPVLQLPKQYSYANQPPVINNYYYNTAPTTQPIGKSGRKKKIVYVSDSDEEEPVVKRTSKPVDNIPEPEPVPEKVYAPAPLTSTRKKLKYNFV